MTTMEKHVLRWSEFKTVPQNYVFPREEKAVEHTNSSLKIPTIDMGKDRAHVVHQLIQASQEFGSFEVINHGVPRELLDEARSVFKEFFELPSKEKERFLPGKGDPSKCILYTSNIDFENEQLHYWREVLKQNCTPLIECIPYWPEKPSKYRVVATEYITKVHELGLRILDLLCEGLGLEPGYFSGALSEDLDLDLNYYPPCPDPSVTMGIIKHSDRSLITILLQGNHVPGLQVPKDGKWITVHPNPDALVLNLGYIIQMVTNGKLPNGDHRAINAKEARQSAALFICPTQDCLIQPAKALVTANNPPLYKAVRYHEFLQSYAAGRRSKNADNILKPFRI